jgi:hypothetical protein
VSSSCRNERKVTRKSGETPFTLSTFILLYLFFLSFSSVSSYFVIFLLRFTQTYFRFELDFSGQQVAGNALSETATQGRFYC